MRFQGGGIGHKATRERMGDLWKQSPLLYDAEVDVDDETTVNDEDKDESDEAEEDDDDEAVDEDEEEAEEDDNTEDFGPEDGEEGCDDEYDVLGFAPF